MFSRKNISTTQPSKKARKAPLVSKAQDRESNDINVSCEKENEDFRTASLRNESCDDVKEDLRNPSDSCLRSAFFKDLLLTLGKLKTFDEIHKFCMNHENKLADYEMIRSTPSILSTGLSVVEDALNLYPADVEQSSVIYPVVVTGDGNCLPYTGSVLAFGHEKYGQEMRVRIVFELAMHKDLYLSNEHLRAGLAENSTLNDLSVAFAMYS